VGLHDQVAEALAAAARTIHHPETLDEVLLRIATATRDSLPAFDLVGISTLEGKRVVTRAATDSKVYDLDRLQYSEDEGPCVDTLGRADLVLAEKLRHEQRWPRYVGKALRLGLRSQMAIKLKLDDQGTLGGLNMYSTLSDDIDPEAASIAELFARHAAIALGGARHVSNLNQALETRKVIGQALGILMERHHMTEERAFAFLVRASSTSKLKVPTVARELVDAANQRRIRGEEQQEGHGHDPGEHPPAAESGPS
jgi:GAF domain-containing protein